MLLLKFANWLFELKHAQHKTFNQMLSLQMIVFPLCKNYLMIMQSLL